MKQSAPLSHRATSDWRVASGNMLFCLCTCSQQEADVDDMVQLLQDLPFGPEGSLQHGCSGGKMWIDYMSTNKFFFFKFLTKKLFFFCYIEMTLMTFYCFVRYHCIIPKCSRLNSLSYLRHVSSESKHLLLHFSVITIDSSVLCLSPCKGKGGMVLLYLSQTSPIADRWSLTLRPTGRVGALEEGASSAVLGMVILRSCPPAESPSS